MSKRVSLAFLVTLALTVTFGCSDGDGASKSTTPSKAANGSGPGAGGSSGAGFGTSSISGVVTFEGAVPAPISIKLDADPYCVQQHGGGIQRADYVVGANQGLKWVFVYVKEGLTQQSWDPPGEAVVLDQKGCQYHPHVFGIMTDQDLKILNSDATLHNIHSLPKASRPFNIAMPRVNTERTRKFTKPEVMVRIKCDKHPWMECWAGVLSHPFHSVTGDDGNFGLDRLPAGTYTIEAWHEDGGPQTQQVTVGEGETKEIKFSFKGT